MMTPEQAREFVLRHDETRSFNGKKAKMRANLTVLQTLALCNHPTPIYDEIGPAPTFTMPYTPFDELPKREKHHTRKDTAAVWDGIVVHHGDDGTVVAHLPKEEAECPLSGSSS